MYFSPQTLKPGYGPDSANIVSAIRIFCFEGHSASRCSITSKTCILYITIKRAPVRILGGTELGCYGTVQTHLRDKMSLKIICTDSFVQSP